MIEAPELESAATSTAPHPGSQKMPQWNVGELPDAPQFRWKSLWQFLGPGLLMGGAAIGGGEWLVGPLVTARYGGGLLWLATLSILGQVLYNIEISRYTLYTGEPIFTGKFRTLPGPMFWVGLYLLLDFGSVFPYLAASAATPLAMMLGKVSKTSDLAEHATLLRWLSVAIFLLSLLPLIFGGKIYNSLKAVMTFKIVAVMGFLLILAIGYSHFCRIVGRPADPRH
jgi:Mn2+/Fe2+ NRAMP family transporter